MLLRLDETAPETRDPMLRLVRAVVPRRVFHWLYSFSLAIFVVLATVFAITSPLDIAVQTWLARLLGIKLLVIFAACATMLVVLLFLYFTRLYKYRVALNHIPARSGYVPLERGDMAPEVLEHVESELQWCVGDVLRRAGPLPNRAAPLHYPGMAPPDYIQQRNAAMGELHAGNIFPPNCIYEDIVDSVGLRLRCEGFMLTAAKIPNCYTMREAVLSEVTTDRARALALLLARLYEALKYGPDLIREDDLAAFLVALDRLLLDAVGGRPHEDEPGRRRSLLLPFPRKLVSTYLHSPGNSSVAVYEPPQNHASLTRSNTQASVASRSSTGSVIRARLAYSAGRSTSSRSSRSSRANSVRHV